MRRWAMSMYINENRTQAEIAEACGVSRQTIKIGRASCRERV